MNCPKCNAGNPNDARYCRQCGIEITNGNSKKSPLARFFIFVLFLLLLGLGLFFIVGFFIGNEMWPLLVAIPILGLAYMTLKWGWK